MASSFDSFCSIGTEKQHKYAASLAEKAGFCNLRSAYANFTGMSVSKVSNTKVTTVSASKFIDWLKVQVNKGETQNV